MMSSLGGGTDVETHFQKAMSSNSDTKSKSPFGRVGAPAWNDEESFAFLKAIEETKEESFDYYTGTTAIARPAYKVIDWPDKTAIRSEAACASRVSTLRRLIEQDALVGPVKNFITRYLHKIFFPPASAPKRKQTAKSPTPGSLVGVVKPNIHDFHSQQHHQQPPQQLIEMRPTGGFRPPQKPLKKSSKHVYEHKPSYPTISEDDIVINATSGAKPVDQDYWNMDAVKKYHLELLTAAPEHVKMLAITIEKTDLYLKKWMDVVCSRELTVTVRQRVVDHHIGIASGLSPAESEVYNYGGHDIALQQAKSSLSEAHSYVDFYSRQRDCLWVAVEVQMNRRPCHQGYHAVTKLPIGFMRRKDGSPFYSPPPPSLPNVSSQQLNPPSSLMSLISVLPSSGSPAPVNQAESSTSNRSTMPKPPSATSAPNHSSGSTFTSKVFQSNGPTKVAKKPSQPVRPFDTSRSLAAENQSQVASPSVGNLNELTSSDSSMSSTNKRRHEEMVLVRSGEMDLSYSGSSSSSKSTSSAHQGHSGPVKRVKLEEEATPHSADKSSQSVRSTSPRLVAGAHRVSIIPKVITDKRPLVTYIIQLDVADEVQHDDRTESNQLDNGTIAPLSCCSTNESITQRNESDVDDSVVVATQESPIHQSLRTGEDSIRIQMDVPTTESANEITTHSSHPTFIDNHSMERDDTFQIKVFELTRDGRTRRPSMISPMLLEVLLLTNVPLHMIDSIQPVYPETDTETSSPKGAAHAFIITLSKTSTGGRRSKRDFIAEFGSELIAPHYPSLSSQIYKHWQ